VLPSVPVAEIRPGGPYKGIGLWLPDLPAVYLVLSRRGDVLYVGRAQRLMQRWKHHPLLPELRCRPGCRLAFLLAPLTALDAYETALLAGFQPPLNTPWEKRYALGDPEGRHPQLTLDQLRELQGQAAAEGRPLRPAMVTALAVLERVCAEINGPEGFHAVPPEATLTICTACWKNIWIFPHHPHRCECWKKGVWRTKARACPIFARASTFIR